MLKVLVFTLSVIALANTASLPGGIIESGMDNDFIRIAKWTTDKMSQYSGIEGDHTVLTVRNAQKQVVAGINYYFTVDFLIAGPENKYYFKSCDVAVNEQAWLSSIKYIRDPTCGNNPFYPNSRISKRQAMAGGWTDSPVTQTVNEIAQWSMSSLTQFTGVEGQQTLTSLSIRNVKTQVVSGVNYWFDLDLLVAGPENKYFFKSCNVKIFDQPWTNTRTFIENPKCGAHPNYPNF